MSLEKLFEPSSVAIIGATVKKDKVGYAILKNIIEGGYKGKVFPVNPKYEEIEGIKVYRSIDDIEDDIDLAIIAIPITYVPQTLESLGKKGVKVAIVISAGGKEAGEEGKRLEEEIVKTAREYGIRFLGPNCFGFINTSIDLNANFGSSMPLKGDTAFISQSGALFAAIMDWAIDESIGFSYCISIGNMADIEFGELVSYLGKKENVKRILIYMESLTDAEKFVRYTREVSKEIPVIIAKAGRSEYGIKAAMSHTGALGGKDFLYSACFKRIGAVRTETVESLFDLTEALSKQPIPKGNRFAVLTNAGGPGVLATDRFDYWNVKPAELSDETIKRLNKILPPAWSKHNPVDILGDATPERYREALKILLEAPEVDGVIGILTPQFMTKPYETAQAIIDLLNEKKFEKPFYFSPIGGERVESARHLLDKNGVAAFETPEEAVDSMILSWKFRYLSETISKEKIVRKSSEEGRRLIEEFVRDKKFLLTEYESKLVFEKYGILVNRTVLLKSGEEIKHIDLKYPLVAKIKSPDILHKTEAGGVIVGIKNERELLDAFEKVIKNAKEYKPDARIEGVIVEEMVEEGLELIVGSSRDKIFKQYMVFGFGGTFVEFFRDVSFDFPPLSKEFAYEMIRETKVYKLLKEGFRGIPPADIEKLVEVLINVSNMLVENPEIVELDINPLIVRGNNIYAVDGRMKLTEEKEEHIIFKV